ncbi:MAG: YhjD/YihY/BrkB family envelope integrity protein [Planctomycetota bacterium]
MRWLDRIKSKGNALLAQEAEELNRIQRALRFCIRLAIHCTQQLAACRAGQMAAALTYHTLFSLLPTIALMLVVARVFVTDDQLDQMTNTAVDYSLQWLEESSGDPAAEGQTVPATNDAEPAPAPIDTSQTNETGEPAPPSTDAEPATDSRLQAFDLAATAVRTQIETWIQGLKSINFSSIGVVGVAFFIYGATALLATIERSFNRIYDTDAGRPLQVRIPMYFTVLVLGPVVLAFGQVVSQQLQAYLTFDAFNNAAEQIGFIGRFFTWLGSTLSPVLTTWLVLLAMYVLLPTAKVSIRHAAIGAAVSAVGWTMLVELFGGYVQRFTDDAGSGQGKLYGALALLPLFLLWLYLTWIIVLFGFVLTRTLQNLKGWEIERQRKQSVADQLVSPNAVVPAMALLAQRFHHGKPLDTDDLATSLNLPAAAAHRIVTALCKAGLVHRVLESNATSTEDAPLTLARSPQSIPMADILDVGDRIARGQSTPDHIAADTMDRLDRARRDAVARLTLADAAGLDALPDPATKPAPTPAPVA